MTALNPREEIVSLLRGYFTCPLISFLGKRGILDKMIDREFKSSDFTEIINNDMFVKILMYFESIGIIQRGRGEDIFCATEIGNKIFKRYGSFCLLHSYGSFLNLLEKVLFDKEYTEQPRVDRVENVVGSGQINNRKYFSHALDMIRGNAMPLTLIDVGCGNGTFIKSVLKHASDCQVIGVDISRQALEEAEKNIRAEHKNAALKTILSDGREVSRWLGEGMDAHKSKKTKSLVITMWYLIHEISQKKSAEVVDFLNEIYAIAPRAEIVIGEITSVSADILAFNKNESIMPEFLFFHGISGQGVLTWEEYQNILSRVPYTLKAEKLFDMMAYGEKSIPSGFIWQLTPKKGGI